MDGVGSCSSLHQASGSTTRLLSVIHASCLPFLRLAFRLTPRFIRTLAAAPVVLKRSNCTVEAFCDSLHKEIKRSFKSALVIGTSAKHARGQKVGLDRAPPPSRAFLLPASKRLTKRLLFGSLQQTSCRMRTWSRSTVVKVKQRTSGRTYGWLLSSSEGGAVSMVYSRLQTRHDLQEKSERECGWVVVEFVKFQESLSMDEALGWASGLQLLRHRQQQDLHQPKRLPSPSARSQVGSCSSPSSPVPGRHTLVPLFWSVCSLSALPPLHPSAFALVLEKP